MKRSKPTKSILAGVVLAAMAMPCLSQAQNFEPKYYVIATAALFDACVPCAARLETDRWRSFAA